MALCAFSLFPSPFSLSPSFHSSLPLPPSPSLPSFSGSHCFLSTETTIPAFSFPTQSVLNGFLSPRLSFRYHLYCICNPRADTAPFPSLPFTLISNTVQKIHPAQCQMPDPLWICIIFVQDRFYSQSFP